MTKTGEIPCPHHQGERRSLRLNYVGSVQESIVAGSEERPASRDSPSDLRRSRKRKDPISSTDPMEEAMQPLTEEERRSWKGWVELESDPVLFSYILRAYGVHDVKVREIFSLDLLFELPKPVYGLIFLFKYQDDDAEEVVGVTECPKNVWFANQTTNNACATIAMLNIAMNAPNIQLGPELKQFKQTTEALKPAYRGLKLSNNDFIRGTHNSFARKMDILNADLALMHDFQKWEKAKRSSKPISSKGKSKNKKKKSNKNESDAGFHYVAYIPVNGVVWRLDGLRRQPMNIGATGDNWMSAARENILQRIAQYEDQGLEYNLMSICQSPVISIRKSLADLKKAIAEVILRMSEMIPDYKIFIENTADDVSTQPGKRELFGITDELISESRISPLIQKRIERESIDPERLINLYKALMQEQSVLCIQINAETLSIEQENEQAERRKHDYTPMIYNGVKALAGANILKDVVKEVGIS